MRNPIVINSNCFDVFKTIADNSIDAIITDPPYGILSGHKIETKLDIPLLMSEWHRMLKDDSPLIFFGLMPKSLVWLNEAFKLFTFRAEVIWCKRRAASFMMPLPRLHENIYIFSKGKITWNKIKAKYEDIKMPMYLDGLLSENTIFCDNKGIMKARTTEMHNDTYFDGASRYFNKKNPDGRPRRTEEVKFQTVWSFTPHNLIAFNNKENNILHPTVKPLLLMDRLIELVTFENQLILDPFAGSGSTLLSAKRLNRESIGIELDLDYFDIINKRLSEPVEASLFGSDSDGSGDTDAKLEITLNMFD